MQVKQRMIITVGATILSAVAHAQDLPETALTVTGGIIIQPNYQLVEKPFWEERVPEQSGGSVTAQIRGWDELGLRGTEVWHLVRDGTLDAASFHLASNAGEVPINGATDLAGLSPTPEDLREVIEAFDPVLKARYERDYNMKILTYWLFQPQITMCRTEISGLGDLKGLKVRVSGKSQAEFMESIGAVPINMAFPEVQTALQTGVIDCGITSAMSAYKSGWYEGVDYLYPLPISWGTNAFLFNLDRWNGLDPQIQSFLTEQIAWLGEAMWQHNLKEGNDGIACMTGQGECPEGEAAQVTLVPVRDEDRVMLRGALEEVIVPGWASQCDSTCVEDWNRTVGEVVGIRAPTG